MESFSFKKAWISPYQNWEAEKADAQNVLQQLYTNPILDVDVIQRVKGKALASAYRLLNDLSDGSSRK